MKHQAIHLTALQRATSPCDPAPPATALRQVCTRRTPANEAAAHVPRTGGTGAGSLGRCLGAHVTSHRGTSGGSWSPWPAGASAPVPLGSPRGRREHRRPAHLGRSLPTTLLLERGSESRHGQGEAPSGTPISDRRVHRTWGSRPVWSAAQHLHLSRLGGSWAGEGSGLTPSLPAAGRSGSSPSPTTEEGWERRTLDTSAPGQASLGQQHLDRDLEGEACIPTSLWICPLPVSLRPL